MGAKGGFPEPGLTSSGTEGPLSQSRQRHSGFPAPGRSVQALITSSAEPQWTMEPFADNARPSLPRGGPLTTTGRRWECDVRMETPHFCLVERGASLVNFFGSEELRSWRVSSGGEPFSVSTAERAPDPCLLLIYIPRSL
jgi:hypothetical protein